MKRNLLILALCFAGIATASAQESFEEYKARLQKEYSTFESEETRKFEEFRKKCNDEYSAMVKKAWELIRAGEAAGLSMLARVPTLDAVWIKKSLDFGAAGVIVPNIDTPEQAAQAVALLLALGCLVVDDVVLGGR